MWQSFAIEQLPPSPLFHYVERFEVVLGMPDNRNRDTDNLDTSIKDMLVEAGVLIDDNWKVLPNCQLRAISAPDNPFTYIKIVGGKYYEKET